MWFIGVEVEQETSAKVLDPPLQYYKHVANGLCRIIVKRYCLINLYYHHFPTAITSSIIQRNSVHHQHLSRMLIEEGYDSSLWIPCYVALRHGWNVSSFHELCGNMAPTLTIVRKDNYLFGGFTEKRWEGKSIAQNVIVFCDV